MRAGALSSRPLLSRDGVLSSSVAPSRAGGPPSWTALGASWAAFVGATLAVAAVVALVAPGLLDGETVELPDRPSLIVGIFANNLLLALIPLLGGWLAAGHRLAGRRALASVFVAIPALVVVRSVATIGAVGGSDGAWLLEAARWGVLELGALAVATHTGMWLARHPEQRNQRAPQALGRALAFVLVALGLAALVEVLTA
ncbi:MAG: hypothetical protein M3433_01695 [Actinomycetota bacterium]|nr:hypothetical protein [Actinomycetota bacterium]